MTRSDKAAEKRCEFVVSVQDYAPDSMRYLATLGDYDLDAPTGRGPTPADAIRDWLDMWGDKLP